MQWRHSLPPSYRHLTLRERYRHTAFWKRCGRFLMKAVWLRHNRANTKYARTGAASASFQRLKRVTNSTTYSGGVSHRCCPPRHPSTTNKRLRTGYGLDIGLNACRPLANWLLPCIRAFWPAQTARPQIPLHMHTDVVVWCCSVDKHTHMHTINEEMRENPEIQLPGDGIPPLRLDVLV